MMMLSVVVVACLLVISQASPLKEKRLGKREAEIIHFGNHQNPMGEPMPDVQLTNTYLGPKKRAQMFKDEEDDQNDLSSEGENIVRKKKQALEEGHRLSPKFFKQEKKYIGSLVGEGRLPLSNPEEAYSYLNDFRRRRRGSMPFTRAYKRKRGMPFVHKRSKRRSNAFSLINPAVLEEMMKAVAAEQLLEEMEESVEQPDNDYLENYEFKYPYYAGMMNNEPSQEEDDESDEEDDEEDGAINYSPEEEDEPPQWLEDNFPQMVRRNENNRKRYSLPTIPLPGQKKKRDQIDMPTWGKIEDNDKRALKKRQQDAEDVYYLASLLDEAQSPQLSFYSPRRMLL